MSLTAGGLIEILRKHPPDMPVVVVDRRAESAFKAAVYPKPLTFYSARDEEMQAVAISYYGSEWEREPYRGGEV